MLDKTAATPIPLSPEELAEASKLFGGSLFSALQLARENERANNGLSEIEGGDDTLKIPIPASMLPMKAAGLLDKLRSSGYAGLQENEGELAADIAPGDIAHAKRNLGKYTLGSGGTLLGSALGAILSKNPASKMSLARNTLLGGATGGTAGTLAGAYMDKARKNQHINEKLTELVQHSAQPAEKMGSEGSILGRALDMQTNPVKMLVHGQSGFRDSRRKYYAEQKKNINDELEEAQREYVDLLAKIKTGADDNTPNVDAFCSGVAHMTLFGKKASDDVDIESGSASRLLSEILGQAKKPFKPAIDTAASGLLGTGAGAAYVTYLMRKKMRENPDKFMEEKLPTRVELQPY